VGFKGAEPSALVYGVSDISMVTVRDDCVLFTLYDKSKRGSRCRCWTQTLGRTCFSPSITNSYSTRVDGRIRYRSIVAHSHPHLFCCKLQSSFHRMRAFTFLSTNPARASITSKNYSSDTSCEQTETHRHCGRDPLHSQMLGLETGWRFDVVIS